MPFLISGAVLVTLLLGGVSMGAATVLMASAFPLLGNIKREKTLVYPINYGYIPGVLGGDGEELDVYLLGVTEPVQSYTCRVIGIVHRQGDVEDKLIAAPEGMQFRQDEIAAAIHFQEKYYETHVEVE